MDTNFTWKAQIVFKGDAEKFTQLAKALEEYPLEVIIPEWKIRPHHLAGCFPIPIDKILGRELIEKLIKGMPRFPLKFIKDIPGGIRLAHLHLEGDIVLLNQDRFRLLASSVAAELATTLVNMEGTDYVDVMGPINNLLDTGQPMR